MDCKNFEGSEERQALFHGDHANNMAYIQQEANAAITGAIGSSGYASAPVSKKRKGQELFFGSTVKDPSIHRLGHFQHVNLALAYHSVILQYIKFCEGRQFFSAIFALSSASGVEDVGVSSSQF